MSSKKPVFLYYNEDSKSDSNLGQRSSSLTVLQSSAPIIEPRMAQLETLEAKMANIEVSLSTTPRRKKSLGVITSAAVIRNTPSNKDVVVREIENLRHALRDKENIIQSLKGQLNFSSGGGSRSATPASGLRRNTVGGSRTLNIQEKRQVEERLAKIKHDMDNKRQTIKNLKMALDRLDITDNIDVRIQQAELEYQLGREELDALSLLEEARSLQLCLEDNSQSQKPLVTLFSCSKDAKHVSLHSLEITFDVKNPRFGIEQRDNKSGLFVEWTLGNIGLCKGDRIVEVNGKLVLNKTKDDMMRLLAVAPDPAQVALLRYNQTTLPSDYKIGMLPSSTYSSTEVSNLRSELDLVKERAEEAQRTKEELRSDNIRLTHRISYLEEQVSELLQRQSSVNENEHKITQHSSAITSTVKSNQNITNISIMPSSPTSPNRESDVQVFQKGPQVTALVANLPGMQADSRDMLRTFRPRSAQQNVSNTHVPTADDSYHRNIKPRYARLYTHTAKHLDYNSESSSAIEHIRQMHYGNHAHKKHYKNDKHSRKKSLTVIEKESKEIATNLCDSRSVDELYNASDSTRLTDARSVKSLDFDSESSACAHGHSHGRVTTRSYLKSVDYTSEPITNEKKFTTCCLNEDSKQRPKPPKKPIRLSLHRAQSLQSVQTSPQLSTVSTCDSSQDVRKPMKRNHKGEAPQVPVITLKIERPSGKPPDQELLVRVDQTQSKYRTDNYQTSVRWPISSSTSYKNNHDRHFHN